VLVLDANILIRAVLGNRVLTLIRQHAGQVEFWAPDAAFDEAREHLPAILAARGIAADAALELLDLIGRIVQTVEAETYAQFEEIARARLKQRDEDDWPVLAAALTLSCPIWTEDTDFFGCGVATWTTDRIELYLAAPDESQSS
jgi:predicted nucleic acid-binding protein